MKTKLKLILAVALCAVGLAAVAAAPSVTVNSVTENGTWSTIDVKYTLSGVDTTADYKVQFDVTAGGVTKTTTDSKAKKSNTSYTKTIDTKTLFDSATRDAKAKVKVSLIEVKPDDVQLWANGPFFAVCNVGASKPEEYGDLIKFDKLSSEVSSKMGSGWRVPTKAEFDDMISKCTATWTEQNGVLGLLVKGNTTGYTDKSIFLPAAGFLWGSDRMSDGLCGCYWSSTAEDPDYAWYLNFTSDKCQVQCGLNAGDSVRAVRD